MINETCAQYVNNLFYGYQTYCYSYNPTEFWLNPAGVIVSFILLLVIGFFIYRYSRGV